MSKDEGDPRGPYANEWPEITLWDVSLDAFWSRLSGITDQLKSETDLSSAFQSVIYPGNDEASERIAVWLRERVRDLREFEDQNTAAPVRRGLSVGRTVLNDLSFTLLENTNFPGPELLALIGELLGIDRHRRTLAKDVDSPKNTAAWIEAQCPDIGVRDLAESLSVAPSSVTRWRQDPEFQDQIIGIRKGIESGIFKGVGIMRPEGDDK